MEQTPGRHDVADDAAHRLSETPPDEREPRADATLEIHGTLKVSPDEDRGGDPYNRTGRFGRLVR
jgi:hypothetical protein